MKVGRTAPSACASANNTQGNGKRSSEWISVELEANTRTGMIKLYIDTQDGALSGLYVAAYMDDTGPGGTWSYVDLIGGYMNWGNVRADPENYFMLDEIVIDDSYIGPPSGFRRRYDGSSESPDLSLGAVTMVRITKTSSLAAALCLIGASLHGPAGAERGSTPAVLQQLRSRHVRRMERRSGFVDDDQLVGRLGRPLFDAIGDDAGPPDGQLQGVCVR